MTTYIAAKLVRLDRDYVVGETIPDDAIDPKMVKRLIEWGKIHRVEVDNPEEEPPEEITEESSKTDSEESDNEPPEEATPKETRGRRKKIDEEG